MGNFAEVGARNGDMYDDISQKMKKNKNNTMVIDQVESNEL